MESALTSLLCGAEPRDGALGDVLGYFQRTIEAFWKQIPRVVAMDDEGLVLFGPTIGRNLLEHAMSAILARLDPLRILMIRQIQLQADYVLGKRYQAAIQWQGDILAEEKQKNMWSAETKPANVSRALLGDYCDHLLWQKAFTDLLDGTAHSRGREWMQELRLLAPEGFTARNREVAGRLYSTLSKGVHPEFVVLSPMRLDANTVRLSLTEVISLVAELALVANAIPHLPFRLAREVALEHFEILQDPEALP